MVCRRQIPVMALMAVMFSATGLGADHFPTAARRQGFVAALEKHDPNYNDETKMLQSQLSSPPYHTTLTEGQVHRTRESLVYAVALLDSGEVERRERAVEMLEQVIALQDQNPASATYGTWPWFLEEPLEQMSAPDLEWADFCGVQLLQVAIDHTDRLPAELQEQVRESVLHAARAIRRRDVGPDHTAVAIMGAYVTLVAGERFDQRELLDYGRQRLRRLYDYTQEKGSFGEYNSPSYTVVAINELTRLCTHVRDAASQQLAEELSEFAWKHLTRRFHAPTRQWAGPHSRAYSTLLGRSVLAFIQRGTGGRVSFMPESQAYESLDAHRLSVACPDVLFEYFRALREPREEKEPLVLNTSEQPDVIGTTYLGPDLALGSVNIGDMWGQRRPLVAHWNASSGPASVRLRCLRDDDDFASASLYAIQDATEVLGAVLLATDRGNRHVSLDRIQNSTIRAQDLRVRLHFEGALDDLTLPDEVEVGKPIVFTSGRIEGKFCVHAATFDNYPTRMETGRDADSVWVDVILYDGVQRSFDLREISQAQVVFTLSMIASSVLHNPDPTVYPTMAGSVVVEGQIVPSRQRWFWRRLRGASMTLTVPIAPLPTTAQTAAAAALLDNLDPWKAAY